MTVQRDPSRRLSRGGFLKGMAGVAGAVTALSASTSGWAEERVEERVLQRAPDGAAADRPLVVYFGTGARGAGVHLFEMDPATGWLTRRDVTEVAAPGWIELDASQRFLYAAIGGNQVASFAIEPANGRLTPLNVRPTGTAGAPHLSIDPTRRFVVTASYGAGAVSVLPVGPDGRLGEASDVVEHSGEPGPHRDQTQARAHMCPFDPTGRWVLVPDLGLDRVYVYRLDTGAGRLIANDPPFVQVERGRGPRHIAFHPNGRLAYVINELNSSMTAFTWDSDYGVLQEVQTLTTLPEGWSGREWSAQVVVHPSGRFVYGSNRGSGGDSDDIAIFQIDQSTGGMTPTGHAATLGQVPRNFNIDPSGRFLICAHQDSDNVVPFRIDQETGALTPTGQQVEVVHGICTQFAPTIA